MRKRRAFFLSLVLMLATGLCFAEANLLADSPWAGFFDNRTEKVDPVTGRLIVKEEGDLKSTFTYDYYGGEQRITGIQYPTGARSQYFYEREKVAEQLLYDENGALVVDQFYTYASEKTSILIKDAAGNGKGRVEFTITGNEVTGKEVYAIYQVQNRDTEERIEARHLEKDGLALVSKFKYLGQTDSPFTAVAWDQLLLQFYSPQPEEILHPVGNVTFAGNQSTALYSDGKEEQTIVKEFDGLGRLKKLTTANTEANFTYDWQGLLSKLDITSGERTESFPYNQPQSTEPAARKVELTYSYLEGKLQAVKSVHGTVSYHYLEGKPLYRIDSQGRRTDFSFDEEKRLLTATYTDGSSVEIQYTAAGKRARMKDAAGETVYRYNEAGLLTELTRKDFSDETFTLAHRYTPAGWLASVTTPAGQREITDAENIVTLAAPLTEEPVWHWFNCEEGEGI